jgi:uncharacterized protein YgbK (DUF1537 family)
MQAALVVADDFSGANDAAGCFASAGFSAYTRLDARLPKPPWPDVIVLNARTRFLEAKKAFAVSRDTWAAALKAVHPMIHFHKIDSTLRGNPEHEAEGLVAATGCPVVAVLPAYPAMGRTVVRGEMWVQGRRLDKSDYAKDPLTPARGYRVHERFSNLPCLPVFLPHVRRGAGHLAGYLKQHKLKNRSIRFWSFDCEQDSDLNIIAQACMMAGCRHYAGASGLAGALADMHAPAQRLVKRAIFPRRLLILAGTVSDVTRVQLRQAAIETGLAWRALTPQEAIALTPKESRAIAGDGIQALRKKGALALSSTFLKEDAAETKRLGGMGGHSDSKIADLAVTHLVQIGTRLSWPTHTVLLTGGHTAEKYFESRGLIGNWVFPPILPGFSLGLAEGAAKQRQWLISKPGGFGGPRNLVQVLRKLQRKEGS